MITQIDDKRSWRAYWVLGMSYGDISKKYAENGIINPKTKKPISREGVSMSIWRYAMSQYENEDTREEFMKNVAPEARESFFRSLVKNAKSVKNSPRAYENWLKDTGLEKYAKS